MVRAPPRTRATANSQEVQKRCHRTIETAFEKPRSSFALFPLSFFLPTADDDVVWCVFFRAGVELLRKLHSKTSFSTSHKIQKDKEILLYGSEHKQDSFETQRNLSPEDIGFHDTHSWNNTRPINQHLPNHDSFHQSYS